MSKSTAQPLQFTIQQEQSFDLQPVEQHSHAQPLSFVPATAYLLFNIKPAINIPQDGQ